MSIARQYFKKRPPFLVPANMVPWQAKEREVLVYLKKLPDLHLDMFHALQARQPVMPGRAGKPFPEYPVEIAHVLIPHRLCDIIDTAVGVFQEECRLGQTLFLYKLGIGFPGFAFDFSGEPVKVIMELGGQLCQAAAGIVGLHISQHPENNFLVLIIRFQCFRMGDQLQKQQCHRQLADFSFVGSILKQRIEQILQQVLNGMDVRDPEMEKFRSAVPCA